MLCYSAWVAWSPAQTGYLAPGSKDSKEHVQYQLLGRWKELQTHVFLLANCTNENNLDSNSITLLAKDDAGHFNIKKRRYWHCRTQILDVWDMLVWGALLKKHEFYIILAPLRHWMQCLAGTCYLKHLKTSSLQTDNFGLELGSGDLLLDGSAWSTQSRPILSIAMDTGRKGKLAYLSETRSPLATWAMVICATVKTRYMSQ